MKVYPCGSNVETKLNNIHGIITGITIRFTAVSYEVSYFAGDNEYKQICLNENEFTINNTVKKYIGFNK